MSPRLLYLLSYKPAVFPAGSRDFWHWAKTYERLNVV